MFRHSCVFVNTSSGISGPAHLVGRTIGEFGTYSPDSGIWAKGILAEDYGFAPERNRWVGGGLETPLPAGFEFTTHRHPEGIDVGFAPPDRTLGAMLDCGEIDALFASDAPLAYLAGSPNIAPLFPNPAAREREWNRSTGIFPMMHTVVARRGLLEANPGPAPCRALQGPPGRTPRQGHAARPRGLTPVGLSAELGGADVQHSGPRSPRLLHSCSVRGHLGAGLAAVVDTAVPWNADEGGRAVGTGPVTVSASPGHLLTCRPACSRIGAREGEAGFRHSVRK
ncbi:hypothetical protein [Streptomyces sp. SDr-06]|uniref:hypothetical protein n=1 Tax=Streptomyces sp. SDr-06 TaxID=2267702 RepID=UPI001679D170|nr:hypothetical protein [Streptomyces sp. SDr-06]